MPPASANSPSVPRRGFLAAVASLGAGAFAGWGLRPAGASPRLLRPPGAVSEEDFLGRCIRCGHCMDVCPVKALVPARRGDPRQWGTPHILARRQPCTLCAGEEQMACVHACPTDALRPLLAREQVAVGVARVDPQTCLPFQGVVCRACWRACPFPDRAIRLDSLGRPRVDPRACVGCGLCEHVCLAEPAAIVVVPFAPKENNASRSDESPSP